MKESKLFKSLVATFMVIVLSGPAVVQAAGTTSYLEVGKARVSRCWWVEEHCKINLQRHAQSLVIRSNCQNGEFSR